MFAWLKPKESSVAQLLEQRDTCLAASAEAHENALKAEELALDDPGKHAKTLAKARVDAADAALAAELANKVVFRRVSGLADAAAARLLAERDRLLGPVSTQAQTRLTAAQANVDELSKQLQAAREQRDAVQRELDGHQQAANELDERIARVQRDSDEAASLDLDHDPEGYHRRRLVIAAERFEETQP